MNKLHAFFEIIHQDPVISQVKLIAEPWDVGEGGYQVGNFPVLWAEWNGKYRDAVRSFWKGDEGKIGELAYRLAGSPIFTNTAGDAPTPASTSSPRTTASPSTISSATTTNTTKPTAKTIATGTTTITHGITVPKARPTIPKSSNFVGSNAEISSPRSSFPQGVPMLTAGDEWARTQQGNNNAYCQDNEISWLNWNLDDEQKALLEFTRTDPLPRRTSGFPTTEILPGPPDSRLRDSRRDVV